MHKPVAIGPFTRIGAQTDILGECPLWSEREQALWWIDIRRPAIMRYDHSAGRIDEWKVSDLVGAIALCADGRLLVAAGDEIFLFDSARDRREAVARLPARIDGHRFNDGRCDPQGRFWIGTMHNITRAPEGVLYRLEEDGALTPVLSGVCIPNSLCWSPDGATMYFADSLEYGIDAFAFDTARGEIGERRAFARTRTPAFPDGSAVDAEGCVWNAEFNGGRIVRYAPDGRILQTVETPTSRPTCCAFGGADLDILFVTTTSQHMSEAEKAADPMAGALLACTVGVRGLPESLYAAAPRGNARENTI
ncbi:MAG: SMP-30/gluconolactonase/LRE family protein [Hyphomicrobiales bacterium]|nr:SMP-30/gluconolactonase/LRE family protein [Hyphomicrobiales bacterium]